MRKSLSRLPQGMLLLGAISLVNVALGFVREATIAYFFGTSTDLDTFLVALAIPQLLVVNLASISVAVVLPLYVGHVQEQRPDLATALAQKWYWFSGAAIAALCLVLYASADLLMHLLAPGFGAARRADAASWLRMLLPYLWLLGVTGIFKAVLNSHHRFAVPAIASQLVSACVIASCAFASRHWGIGSLAGGLVAGGMAAFTWQLLHALKYEPTLQAPAGLRHKLKLPLAASGALLLSSVARQLSTIIDRAFASGLPDGSIAAYNYAGMLNALPTALVTSAVTTALFPVLARLTAEGESAAALRTVRKWSLGLCLSGIGPVLLMVFYRQQLVTLIFKRGAFGDAGVSMTSDVLQVLPFMGLTTIVTALFTRLLLVQKRARVIAMLSVVAIAVKLALNKALVAKYGLLGLASATLATGLIVTSLRVAIASRAAFAQMRTRRTCPPKP